MREGDFHHVRDPTVTPRAKSVRFLCPLCHRRYGHKRVTRKVETFFGTEKETKLVRQEVTKVKKPAKKKAKKTKRVAVRDILGNVVGYRTVKVRKAATKKKTTKAKMKTPAKKKTTTRKSKIKTAKTSARKRKKRKKKSDEWLF